MKKGEGIALVLTIAAAAPLVFFFARAAADGEMRRRESPVRALLGDEAVDQLTAGEQPPQHYFGDDRLAPDFELRDQEGRPWRLRDHAGKVVVMNFWSITCRPCVEEMPSLVALADAFHDDDDVEVVSVTTDRDWATVRSIFPAGSRLPVLFDPDRRVVTEKYGTRLFPETWIIDPDGIIRLRVDGARDWSSPLARDLIRSFR